jgi:hypothetical protein
VDDDTARAWSESLMSSIMFGHAVTSVAVNADLTAMWSISGPAGT